MDLGCAGDNIGRVFVSTLVLRSKLDAAHVRLAALAADERRKLQLFMEAVGGEFAKLLRDLARRAASGEIKIAPYDSERSAGDELSKLFAELP
jgi:hypothetical protein